MMRTASLLRVALASGALMLAASGASAQEGGGLLPGANGVQKRDGAVTTCSARNALATKQCSTTCQAGQSAECTDADGAGDPTCECTGG